MNNIKAPPEFQDKPGRAEARAMERIAGPASYVRIGGWVPIRVQLWVIRVWLYLQRLV